MIIISAVWCPDCLIMKKEIKKIKEKYPNIEYIEYDYDMDEDEVSKYNVSNTLPLIIIEKDGKEVFRDCGAKKEKQLINVIEGIGL